MDDPSFADVALTVKCPQCQKMSIKPIMEIVDRDFTTCNRCAATIDLRHEMWQTAIRETLKRAKEIKSGRPG